ncbi:MAG: hypothetical protein WAL63_20550 [Solirubrobacteraceae bacterium]
MAAGLAAAALAACGATPPQAPLPMAQRLDRATSGISTACGESYQVTAFAGDHARDLAVLRATATASAAKLASVDARNPAWIYQGQTVSEIVANSIAALKSCGLSAAAAPLRARSS